MERVKRKGSKCRAVRRRRRKAKGAEGEWRRASEGEGRRRDDWLMTREEKKTLFRGGHWREDESRTKDVKGKRRGNQEV